LQAGQFTVTVSPDTATIGNAITNFVNQYNQVQGVITTQTATTTDSSGNVTAGPLAGDMPTEDLAETLRNLVDTTVPDASGASQSLDNLGFSSNGNDNTLLTSDTAGLDSALATNLAGLQALFTQPGTGVAVQLSSLLSSTLGTNGTLTAEENDLTSESSGINTQISNMELNITQYQNQLTTEFVNMETAEEQTNEQMAYLSKTFS